MTTITIDTRTDRTPCAVAEAVFAAIAARDPDAVVAFASPETCADFVALGELHGPVEVRSYFRDLFDAFPDFTIVTDRVVADDRVAVVQWHASGTFTGAPYLGVLPTGRPFELRGVDVFEIDGGHVRRNTVYFDGAAMARALGLLPPEGGMAERAVRLVVNLRTRAARAARSRGRARAAASGGAGQAYGSSRHPGRRPAATRGRPRPDPTVP